MATGTAPRGPQATPPANKAEGRWLEYDQFIDAQLRKARGHVKGVELAGALMGLAAGGLLYFLLVSVLDHWLVSGGLGFWGRLACLAVFLAGAGWFVVRRLGPLLIRRINPVYAAETIEKSKPSLKNALINFLFLRGDRSGVPQVVFQAVEEQAASSLQRTPVEATVDRTKVIQIGYVLLAIVAIFAAYKLFSPKDPLETFQRVVMPWADIQAPTRVTIVDVSPGDSTKYLGEAVEVSAEVRGVGADEPVRILYTTADQGTVDQAVVMYRAADSFRHTGKIPSGEAGLQQDIEYRIESGDAISPTYHLKAAAAPTITVESIDYEFPAYMERAKAHVENTGDIQAYEGTSVTIHGRANQPLKSAQLVLDGGDNRHQEIALEPMQSDRRNIAAKFTLKLNEGDHSPEFSRYQLRPEGRAKPEPAQYKIDVFADLPPEIKFLAPEKDEMTVPVNGSLQLELRAHDPDFALSEVTLSANVDDKQIIDKKLLSERHSGPLLSKFRFQPAKLGLKEGDTVSYWAAAKDNRTPTANEAHTPHRLIRVVKAEQRRASNEPAANDAKENPDPNANPNDDNAKPKDDERPNHNPKDANDNPTPDAQNPDNPESNQANQQNNGQDNPGRDNRPKEQSRDGNQSQDDKHDQSKSAGEQKGPKSSGGSGSEKSQKPDGSGAAKQDAGKGGDSSKGNSSQAGKSGGSSAKGNQPNDKQPADQKGDPSGGGQSNGAQPNGKQSSDPSRGTRSDASQPKSGQQGDQQTKGQPQSDGSDAGKSSDGGEGSKQQSQDNPSSIAKTAEALRQAVAQQKPNSGGNSGQQSDKQSGQSAGKQSGQSGTDGQSKNSGGTGDQASDGASKNPSTNPQGSGGPAPNGKPGTGAEKGNQKPSGANQKSGDKQNGSQNSPDQKNGPQPNGNQKAPGDKSGETGDQKRDGQNGTSPQQPGTNPNRDGSKADKPPGDNKPADQPHSGSQSQPGDKSQPNGQAKSQDKSQPGNPSQPGDKAQDKSPNGNNSQPGNPSDQGAKQPTQKPGDSPQPGDASKPSDKTDKTGAGQQPSADKRNSNSENGDNKAGQSDTSKQGDGAQAKQGSQPSDQKRDQPENGGQQQPDAKGGDPERAKGKSGSGQQDNDKSGSASPQEGNKPNEHKDDSNGGQSPKESGPGDNAKSPSNSSKESNSKGSEGGDRSGGGKSGAGQSSNQAGTGGAGQNTAADEGKGKAEGAGKGEDSSKPGADKQSDKATGQSGNQAGNGSGTSDKPANDGARSSKSGDKSQGGSGTDGPGGNRVGELPDGAAPDTSPVNGDAANMDFARKQFDLALDRLKKGNPDLLKELNWSGDDAQKLADRLEQMKSAANASGPEGDRARKQMDELLRNLGSRAGQLNRGGDRTANDAQRGVRESNDSGPPAEYQDLFNAFQQGAARGGR
jgi:collagen type III alpha